MTVTTHDSYDAFLSYAWQDHTEVERIANFLQETGVRVFLDRWYMAPGKPWQEALEEALGGCASVVIFVGRRGMDGWQQREAALALDQQRRTDLPVIPVLLPGAEVVTGFLSLNTWVDMRGGIDDSVARTTLTSAIYGEPPGPAVVEHVREVLEHVSPYRGLAAFREEDAPFFFGREAFTERLVEAVGRHPIVAVVGPSGSGKSSVVRAGLVPHLRMSAQPDASEVANLVPGPLPLHSLAASLLPLLEPEMDEVDRLAAVRKLASHLRSGDVVLSDVVTRIVEKQPGTDRLVLVVDQWEELYTQTRDASDRDAFIDTLIEAVSAGRVAVVLNLRASFYGEALRDRSLADQLQDAIVNLSAMNPDEIRSAVVKPAELVGLGFEHGLVDRILDDVGSEPGNLPLLEFLLLELWQNRRGGMLLHEVYDEIGGVQGAIATRANEVLQRLHDDEHRLQRIFGRLVQTRVGMDDARRRIPMDDLREADRVLVRDLADERLLVTALDESTGTETVEVAHEALIRNWDQLRTWLDSDREFLLWRQRLRNAVDAWHTADEDAQALLRGVQLGEAQAWLASRADDLNADEIEFIERSANNRENERTRQRQREAAANVRTASEVPATAFVVLAAFSLVTVSFIALRSVFDQPDQRYLDYVLAVVDYLLTLYTPVVAVTSVYGFAIWVSKAGAAAGMTYERSWRAQVVSAVLPYRRVANIRASVSDRLASPGRPSSLAMGLWRVGWPLALALGLIENVAWITNTFALPILSNVAFPIFAGARTAVVVPVAALTILIMRALTAQLTSGVEVVEPPGRRSDPTDRNRVDTAG